MRTKNKWIVLGATIVFVIPCIIGAGMVKEAAHAARARELAEVRAKALADAKFASTVSDSQTRISGAFASVNPQEVIAIPAPSQEESDPLVIRNEGDFSSVKIDIKSLLCMGDAVYGEAGNEKRKGQIAVGLVILNRLQDPSGEYGKDVCEVAMMYNGHTGRWQFDGMKTRSSFRNPEEHMSRVNATLVAQEVLRGEWSFTSVMKDVKYFYAKSDRAYHNPHGPGRSWLMNCTTTRGVIGGHIFSTDDGHCKGKQMLVAQVRKPVLRFAKRVTTVASFFKPATVAKPRPVRIRLTKR